MMHSYPVFFVAFLAAFGWGRAEASVAYSASQLLTGASSPVVGLLVDRIGPRRLVLMGGVFLAAGLALSARVTVAVAPDRPLRRGHDDRGELPGPGGGDAAHLAPVRRAARARAVDRPGGQRLRTRRVGPGGAVPDLHGGLATVVPGAGGPDGDRDRAPRAVLSGRPHARARRPTAVAGRARRRRRPRLDARGSDGHARTSGCSSSCTCSPGSAASSSRCTSWRSPPTWASSRSTRPAFSGMGSFFSVAGTIFTGTISDYVGREVSAIIAYGISIIGVIAALFITNADQTWLLWIHAGFFGLTWGARGPMITAKTADLFQGRHLGAILGVISIGTGIGAAVGRVGERVDLRSLRELPAGVHPVDRVVPGRVRGLLVPAPSGGGSALSQARDAGRFSASLRLHQSRRLPGALAGRQDRGRLGPSASRGASPGRSGRRARAASWIPCPCRASPSGCRASASRPRSSSCSAASAS